MSVLYVHVQRVYLQKRVPVVLDEGLEDGAPAQQEYVPDDLDLTRQALLLHQQRPQSRRYHLHRPDNQ